MKCRTITPASTAMITHLFFSHYPSKIGVGRFPLKRAERITGWQIGAELDPKQKEQWLFQQKILPTKSFTITRNIGEGELNAALQIMTNELYQKQKEDCLFQDAVCESKTISVHRSNEIELRADISMSESAELMISKFPFTNNVRLDAKIFLKEKTKGIGFLFNVPDKMVYDEGSCFWLSHTMCKLFHNNVKILEEQLLQPKTWYQIRIEKTQANLKLYIDGNLKLKCENPVRARGGHAGLMFKDPAFEIEHFRIFNATTARESIPNDTSSPDL